MTFVDKTKAWWASLRPSSDNLKEAAVAGLPRAAASVPDGMAAAALVGVNPIHGLYASFAGPIVGGLTSSTKLMVITTTSAASLAAYSALLGVPAEDRMLSLFLLTILAGGIMVVAGFLRPWEIYRIRLPLGDDWISHRGCNVDSFGTATGLDGGEF